MVDDGYRSALPDPDEEETEEWREGKEGKQGNKARINPSDCEGGK